MVTIPSIFQAMKAKSDKERQDIFEGGYYTMGGMVAGMLTADLWNKFDLPGNDVEQKTSLITGKEIPNSNLTSQERLYQYVIAGLMILLEMIFDVKGGIASGTGFFLGINFIDKGKKKGYIGEV